MAWLAVLWTLGCLKPSSPVLLADPPSCIIPYSEFDILCEWTPGPHTGLPINYTLHWSSEHEEGSVQANGSSTGLIRRQSYYRLSYMTVWVSASNTQGTNTSHTCHTSPHTHFLPSHIAQPPPPHYVYPEWRDGGVTLRWKWSPPTGEECGSPINCTVRYRTAGQQNWTLEVGVSSMHFQLDEALPFTQYQFQVRCTCVQVMSSWSSTATLLTPEAAPLGVVDVWTDCGPSSPSVCNITWKNLSASLLRGLLQAFEFREEFRNGTIRRQNLTSSVCESTAGVCVCRQAVSRLDITGVCLSAYNSHGFTQPACITLHPSHTEVPLIILSVKREEEEKGLIVSWATLHRVSEHVQEYVLQRQRAGLPLPDEFDWMRVQGDKNSALLTGQFRDCTPYEVSLFAQQDNQSRLMASTVAFSRQCVPPEVPFQIHSNHDSATVLWTHTHLKDVRGHVLLYQLLFNGTVHNVSGEDTEHKLTNLQPGRFYEVSLWAITGGGPGSKTHSTFTTTYAPGLPVWLVVLLIVMACVSVFCLTAAWWIHKPHACYVPDPQRSHLHRELIHLWHPEQFYSLSEPMLKCSPLEVLHLSDTPDALHLSDTTDTHDQLSPHPQELLYPARAHLYPDTTDLCGPLDNQHMEPEWFHIPMERASSLQGEEEVIRGRGESGSSRIGDYSDSHALDEEVVAKERRSTEREEEEGGEEEGNYGDMWMRVSDADDEEQEEDSWDFFMKPGSDYERHMPVAQC